MREWWLRTILVLSAPRPVFAALRDDSNESAAFRSEPVLLVVWLAGMVFVLSTRTAAHSMDGSDGYDATLLAIWTFLAGGLFGGVFYWVLGGILHRVTLLLGSQGSYRRARHILAFSTVPVALSLLVLWPVKLAVYGSALFHEGGPDSDTGGKLFEALSLGFLVWSACLLVVGVRAVHGWSWGRALAAAAAPILLTAAFLAF
ncbi:MAG TPA: Yip1 family protein [Gaiellaceae bacterium]|jgi:hypothetical protein|nr:Yip1 family protein [Gaiellaceae bacterium]